MAYSEQIATATIYMEASGEGPDGELAVAHVLLNRKTTGKWGHTLAEVCLAAEQFSCWNTKDPNRMRVARLPDNDPILASAADALQKALTGTPDPTGGAINYYAPASCPEPDWASEMIFTVQIGKHRFYKAA